MRLEWGPKTSRKGGIMTVSLTVSTAFLIIALVLLLCAAFKHESDKIDFTDLGLACVVAALLAASYKS